MQALPIDDHALFREGMKYLPRHLRPDATVRQAANVNEAAEFLTRDRSTDPPDLHIPGITFGHKRCTSLRGMAALR